jgi:hypothetical protein
MGSFENVDKWLQIDACELGFQHMTDMDIVNAAVKQKGEEGVEDESEEEGESSECAVTAWHYSVLTLTGLHGSERAQIQ